VNALAQKAISEFGKIDIWVNDAAVSMLGRFEDTPMEDIRRVIDINLFGYIHGAKAVIPHFKERKEGTLVNVSSIVGLTGQPFSLAYTVSKFAIRGLSVALQQELADEKNIHVCTVLPGTIDTPLFQHAANYMGKEVQAPGPAKDADEVAKEILKLTKDPKKEVVVGKFPKIPAYMARAFTPGLFDKQMRKLVSKSHFSKEAAARSKGNLYEPMKEYATISGGWQHEKHSSTAKKVAIGGAVLGAAIGATLLANELSKKDGEPESKNIGEI
jgi:short-subunit dehydrogenase